MKTKWNVILLKIIKVGVSIVLLLLVLYAANWVIRTGYDFGYRVFTEEAIDEEPGTDVLVQVTEGMSGLELGKMLFEKGLVRDANLFFIQYRVSAYYDELVPGVYTLNTSMTSKDMIVIMASETIEETEETEAQEVYMSEDDPVEEVDEGAEEELAMPEAE